MDLYTQSVVTYRSRLEMLSAMLTKAEAHAGGDALLEVKLADDMHPLATQVRFVTNIPGEAMSRLGVRDFTSSDDTVTSFDQARELIIQTTSLMDGIAPHDLPLPDKRVSFAIGDGAFHFELSAEEYVREFSLPNFYFHLSMAYAILRMKGVDLGKADFIPHMAKYFRQPPS